MNLIDDVISVPAKRIDDFSEDYQPVIDEMFALLNVSDGVGLAMPQVGFSKQLAVIEYQGQRLVIVNPTWSLLGGQVTQIEGCLSFAGKYSVRRPNKVRIVSTVSDGSELTLIAQGHLARIIQHEIDHLMGVTVADIGHRVD
jgi:peptide deformylase